MSQFSKETVELRNARCKVNWLYAHVGSIPNLKHNLSHTQLLEARSHVHKLWSFEIPPQKRMYCKAHTTTRTHLWKVEGGPCEKMQHLFLTCPDVAAVVDRLGRL